MYLKKQHIARSLDGLFLENSVVEGQTFKKKQIQGKVFKKIRFQQCVFTGFHVLSTQWHECQFVNCRFEGCFCADSLFQDSSFEKCAWKDVLIETTRFHSCLFVDLQALEIQTTGSGFVSCTFKSGTLQRSFFADTHGNNIAVSQMASALLFIRSLRFQSCQFTENIFSKQVWTRCDFLECSFDNCSPRSLKLRHCQGIPESYIAEVHNNHGSTEMWLRRAWKTSRIRRTSLVLFALVLLSFVFGSLLAFQPRYASFRWVLRDIYAFKSYQDHWLLYEDMQSLWYYLIHPPPADTLRERWIRADQEFQRMGTYQFAPQILSSSQKLFPFPSTSWSPFLQQIDFKRELPLAYAVLMMILGDDTMGWEDYQRFYEPFCEKLDDSFSE